jgi:hypothetical protein
MALLARCIKGETTNSNESIHHALWSKCPKEKFVSLSPSSACLHPDSIQFNEGHIGKACTMQNLALPVSPTAGFRMRDHDASKEAKSKAIMTKKAKAKRSKRKLDKTKTAAQKIKWEGTVYGYGLEERTKKKK